MAMTEPVVLERREMFREIKQLCGANNWTNWFVLLREYAIFAVTVAACVGWYHHVSASGWSLMWAVPVYFLAVLVIGTWTQNRLGVLIHESSHYSLFKNRTLNELASNWLVAFPLFAAINNYRAGHWGHHRHVNDPEHDPDLLRLQKHQPRHFPIGRGRFLWEYCVLQLMPHKALSYLKGRALYAMIPAKNQEPAKNIEVLPRPLFRVLCVSYYVLLFAALTVWGWWPHYLLLWVVPMVTFYPVVLFLREIAHHGNYPDNGDYTNSRVYGGKWLEREIFFPFGEWNHVLHHMFPTVPWYRTREAHEVLMRYPPYRDNVVYCDGFFFKGDPRSDAPTVLDVLAKPSRVYLRSQMSRTNPDGIRHSTAAEVGSIGEPIESWHGGES
ncbi:MAG: fatty acid desaturase [Planctomycetaceae bacterium]|nr:MAG: fatty acid desaturase [Planctomycetaceae bacterium]